MQNFCSQYNNFEIWRDKSDIRKVLCLRGYLTGYSDKAIKLLVFIIPKTSGYVKIFKVKDGGKDKNNRLMFFQIGDEKLLKKYKSIRTKIEDLKNLELNTLPVYNDRYIKTKITFVA